MMNGLRGAFVLLISAGLLLATGPRTLAQGSAQESAMVLENDEIRVVLDGSTGGFASIRQKAGGEEFLDPSPAPMLFRVFVPEGDRLYRHEVSRAPAVRRDGGRLVLSYVFEDFTAEVEMALLGSGVLATLKLVNTGARTIEEVQFPWIMNLRRRPGDAIVTPSFRRRFIEDPLGAGLEGDHRHAEEYLKKEVFRYPERMTTAWCDYGNSDRGLALEARHTDFSIVDFFVHKAVMKSDTATRRALNLGTVFPRRVRPGESWTSPPIRVFVHEGDWHAAADAHREWVETWIRKPERPAKFAESIGWHYFFMKHQDGFVRFTYADLPRMAEAALAGGCPYILVFGWHEPGHDNRYMYGYVPNREWGGEAALREALEKVQALGVEVVPFYNGTLANTRAPEHLERGHRWEALTREGHPYYAGDWAGFNFDAPATSRGRIHHEICLCDEYRPVFQETATRLFNRYGFGNIQLDQAAIKMAPCYSEDHGHDHPDRAYVDGWQELLPRLRAALRTSHPEGVMISECTNEFIGQWCDGAWTWDFLSRPEPVLYSVPWLLTSTAIDANEYAEANKAFALKISMDLRIGGGDELLSQYPSFAAHLKALSDLRHRAAPYHAYADFRDREGITALSPEGPGLVAASFINRRQGKAGIVLGELEGKTVEVRLKTPWRPRNGGARMERSTGAADLLEMKDGAVWTLRPYETAVVCLELE